MTFSLAAGPAPSAFLAATEQVYLPGAKGIVVLVTPAGTSTGSGTPEDVAEAVTPSFDWHETE